MHTSTLLSSGDFTGFLRSSEAGEWKPVPLAALFPDYHELDRVGVVSPGIEDGVLFTGATLLALTTAFYDVQRERGPEFFNYPQHFALLGSGVDTPSVLGATWGNLDVWPEANWHAASPTASEMLRLVFSLQVSRLFWPERLQPGEVETRMPDYARRLLHARLKSVYLYNTSAPNATIQGSPNAEGILRKSVARLPGEVPSAPEIGRNRLRSVPAEEFLAGMADCFE